jgi:hypothetical protein
MPERRKIFEAEDSDFGGGAWVPCKTHTANDSDRLIEKQIP